MQLAPVSGKAHQSYPIMSHKNWYVPEHLQPEDWDTGEITLLSTANVEQLQQ